MDGASATVLAAAVGALAVFWQHRAHWKEARRDKVRDAYAAWSGKLMTLRRKDEMVMEMSEFTFQNQHTQAMLGNKRAEEMMRNGLIEVSPQMLSARGEQHAAQEQEDAAFGLVVLLDSNERRVLKAQAVRRMQVFVEVTPGSGRQTMNDFHERWKAQEEDIGQLLVELNRTLALERSFEFAWDFLERMQANHEEALEARLRLDRLGRRVDGALPRREPPKQEAPAPDPW